MFKKLFAFSGLLFAGLGARGEKLLPPDYEMNVPLANETVRKHRCPGCEDFMTLSCLDGQTVSEPHSKRCAKCGAQYAFDAANTLLSLEGYHPGIRRHFLYSRKTRDRMPDTLHVRIPESPMAHRVTEELDSMHTQTAMAAYTVDRINRKAA